MSSAEAFRRTACAAGPFALVLRESSEADPAALASRLGEAFAPFIANGNYATPGLAVKAVPS